MSGTGIAKVVPGWMITDFSLVESWICFSCVGFGIIELERARDVDDGDVSVGFASSCLFGDASVEGSKLMITFVSLLLRRRLSRRLTEKKYNSLISD